MTTTAWYHCSVKTVSRSAGRSVVAAAAYRLGECLHDETHAVTHDYTRKQGIEASFTVTPDDAPEWAHDPELLWNAAERRETRKNSTLAREVELALPSFLTSDDRQRIAERFAHELVNRYGVAVSVALHEPGRHGDDRNYHAHILFTTRELTAEGLGDKTRILDDRKTGPQEVVKLRALAADIINEALREANSDVRVDHRSFKERGIEQEPTTHLGPAATEMERRGEPSDRGDINREARQTNDELGALDKAIEAERERISSPPQDRTDAQARVSEDVEPLVRAIRSRGTVADIQSTDGLSWWQRAGLYLAQQARTLVLALSDKARQLWQHRTRDTESERGQDGGFER